MKRVPKLTTTTAAILSACSLVLGVVLFLWGNSMNLAADDMETDFSRSYTFHRSVGGDGYGLHLYSDSGTRPSMTVIRYESELADARIGAELLMQLGGVAILFALFLIPVAFVVHREKKKQS